MVLLVSAGSTDCNSLRKESGLVAHDAIIFTYNQFTRNFCQQILKNAKNSATLKVCNLCVCVKYCNMCHFAFVY